ncbi:MAG: hypothetical protein GXO56_01955 [Chloroflexi bacterium]|nr:hypothetical protein [Chloroflexota bacterium]
MLLTLWQRLRAAEEEGRVLSLEQLAHDLDTDVDSVRQMLEVLAWEGKVQRVESTGCGLAEEGGCAACPLNKICTRGVTHHQEGFILALHSVPRGRS